MSKVQISLIVLLAVALSAALPAVSAQTLLKIQAESGFSLDPAAEIVNDPYFEGTFVKSYGTASFIFDQTICLHSLAIRYYANVDDQGENWQYMRFSYWLNSNEFGYGDMQYRRSESGSGAADQAISATGRGFDPEVTLDELRVTPPENFVQGTYLYWDWLEINYSNGACDKLTRPLKAADEHTQWGMFELSSFEEDSMVVAGNRNIVTAFSEEDKAPVHAMADGTVLSVLPITNEACGGYCKVAIPPHIALTGNLLDLYRLEMLNTFKVVIQTSENKQHVYILANPKVKEGDVVAAGCVLGETVELLNLYGYELDGINLNGGLSYPLGASLSATNLFPQSQPLLTGIGVTITASLDASGMPEEFFSRLELQPNGSACTELRMAACVNSNPDLIGTVDDVYDINNGRYADGFVYLNSASGSNPSNIGFISQQNLVLSTEEEYTLAIAVYGGSWDSGYGNHSIIISADRELEPYEFTLTGNDLIQVDIPNVATAIKIQTGFSDDPNIDAVTIDYICLMPKDASSITPGVCYFANAGFELNGYAWDTTTATFGSGQAFLDHNASIAQSAQLNPNDDGTAATYKVEAKVRLNASGSYTGQVGKSIALSWQHNTGETNQDGTVGIIDSVLVQAEGKRIIDGSVDFEHVYTLSSTFTKSANEWLSYAGAFTFAVAVTDPDQYLRGLRIDSVCIIPQTDDGSWPGYPGTGPYRPPFVEQCQLVPPPLENSIGAWTFYQYKNLSTFFSCDLMKLLNSWHRESADAIRTSRYFMRWMIVYQRTATDWLWDVIPWAEGHFRNMAVGQVTYIEGNQQLGFWDVLALFFDRILTPVSGIISSITSLINQAVSFGFDIIRLIIAVVIKILAWGLASLLNSVGLASDLAAQAQAGAVQAQAEPWLTLPNCVTAPKGHGICIALWVAQNTIWAGWGMLLTLVVTGIGSIELILYLINKNADTFNKVSERL